MVAGTFAGQGTNILRSEVVQESQGLHWLAGGGWS